MEFWLFNKDKSESLQLPVPPSQFQIVRANNNTTVDITTAGELNLIGKSKLATISFDTFFPNQNYYFCQYTGFPKPYDCIKLIEKWRTSSNPIRFIVTGTDINMAASIEEFDYGEQDGTRDVYFSLSLKEYRFIGNSAASSSSATSAVVRQTKAVPTTYTVKKGDTLFSIARKVTGDSSNYAEIASQNGITNPNEIYVGEALVIS